MKKLYQTSTFALRSLNKRFIGYNSTSKKAKRIRDSKFGIKYFSTLTS